jgi:hypothetical protein
MSHTAWVIEDGLSDRGTGLHRPHVAGLAEWQSMLPRKTGGEASKERYPRTHPRALSGRLHRHADRNRKIHSKKEKRNLISFFKRGL